MLQGRLRERVTVQLDPGVSVELTGILADADLQQRIQAASPQHGPHQHRLRQAARLENAASAGDGREMSQPIGLLQFGGSRRVNRPGLDRA